MSSSRARRLAGCGVLVMVALLSIGCERWPWESKGESSQPTAATPQPPPLPSAAFIPDTERVAVVNGTSVSTTDMELATTELKRFVQAYQQTWNPLKAEQTDGIDLYDVLDNVIDAELKAQDAKARGLDRKTEVQRRLAYLQRGFYAQEWDRKQRELAIPTEEAIHQFYEQNKGGFMDPERIRVSQIVTQTLADAEAVRGQAIQGVPFPQLAKEKSVGAGKEQGGDVGWYLRAVDRERLALLGASPTEAVFFPQLEPIAFALEVNQVSQPVKGPDGYYLVQLTERKPARQRTELEVHDAIKELLTLQKLQGQLEELRKKAQVQRFEERLKDVLQQ